MQRKKFEEPNANRLSLARAGLEARTRELMKRAGVVFRSGNDFCPEAVRRIGIIERVSEFEEKRPGVPLPDGPVAYQLPAIILPSRKFVNPNTHQEVPRVVAATMTIEYDDSRERGLIHCLPEETPAPDPDRVMIELHPVLLGETRFDDSHPSQEQLTVSHDYVRVYQSPWEQVGMPNNVRYPIKSWKDELKDWGAFRRYSGDSLTQTMVDYHTLTGDTFAAQLGIVEDALRDTTLNPRPKQ